MDMNRRSLENNSRSIKSYLLGSMILLIVSIYVKVTYSDDNLLYFLNSSSAIFYFSLFAIITFITSFVSIHNSEGKSSILIIIMGLFILATVHLGYYYFVLIGGLPLRYQMVIDLFIQLMFFCIAPFFVGTAYGIYFKKRYRKQ